MPAQGQTAFQTPIQAEAPAKTTYVLNPYLAGVHVRDTFYTRCGKRILDIVICSLGLVIALPVMGIIALITLFDVGRPVLFRQTRIGKDCKPFTIIKFKNMTDERDENGELLLAEYRVTKIGKKIRDGQMEKVPYMLIVGDRDIEAGTVSPRHRTDGDLGAMTLDAFAAQLREVVDSKAKK